MARILTDAQTQKFVTMLRQERCRESRNQIPEGDWRTMFDSDYARMVLSASVRRMQDKTQVFPNESVDFARTRLTHSMEVAAFARSLGYNVEQKLKEDFNAIGRQDVIEQHWIPKILEVAGLVHDIGNPPFGHKGEKSIKTFFRNLTNSSLPQEVKQAYASLSDQQRADFENFDGNVQGFLILTKLGLASDDYSFNLTKPVLRTIVKYPYSSLDGNKKGQQGFHHDRDKFGFFESEQDRYTSISTALGLNINQRHPLTYLVEAADDIAYTACDIEDGFHLGVIKKSDIEDAFKKHGEEAFLHPIFAGMGEEEYKMQTLRIAIQSKMIGDCADVFIANISGYIDGTNFDTLLETSNSQNIAKALKDLENLNVSSRKVLKKEEKGDRAITYLLGAYICSLFSPKRDKRGTYENKIFNSLSENYWVAALRSNNNYEVNDYYKFQYAVNQIAGMTDTYLFNQYNYVKIISPKK